MPSSVRSYWTCLGCVPSAQRPFGLHSLLRLKLEIPLLHIPWVFLVWHIYSARSCTLITPQLHTTPEHIKASSVHLLRPQTVLKEGRGKGKQPAQMCRYVHPLVTFSPLSGDVISLSHFSPHEFTSGHWNALQRCRRCQSFKTSLPISGHYCGEATEILQIAQHFSALKKNMVIMFRVGDQGLH